MDERDERCLGGLRQSAAETDADELDLELAALFSSFDKVSASDELKASTLAAVLAELDAEDASAGIEATLSLTEETPMQTRSLVVDGGKSAIGARGKVLSHGRANWWLRVAAVLVAVSLTAGGVAYALPASHVVVTQDEVSIDLGINVFGRAVSAQCDNSEVQALLDEAGVRNVGYEEALDRVLDTCDELREGPDGTDGSEGAPVEVEVNGAFSREDGPMATRVNRVMEDHAARRTEPMPSDGPQDATDDGMEEPEPSNGSMDKQPATPSEEGGTSVPDEARPLEGPGENSALADPTMGPEHPGNDGGPSSDTVPPHEGTPMH